MTEDRHQARIALARTHGDHAQAQASLQPGMAYLDVETPTGHGFVAYARAFGATIILGEPVCPHSAIDEVLDVTCATLPRAVFFQVGADCAARLRARGLTTTPIGIEPVLALDAWRLDGKKKQSIRTARNRARATGITTSEWHPGRNDVSAADIAGAVTRWHRTRRRRTLRFLVPPMRPDDIIAGVPDHRRLFVAKQGAQLMGFVGFDVIVRDGAVVGYTPSVSVASPSFRPGLWYAVMAEALAVFQEEQIPVVNLGLLPLSHEGFTRREGSALLRLAFRVLRLLGSPIYNFSGIDHAKRRFGGDGVLSYMAHRGPLPVFSLAALLWLTVRGPRHPAPIATPADGTALRG